MTPPVLFRCLDQELDLALGQMLARAKLAVRSPPRSNCPIFCCWQHQREMLRFHEWAPVAFTQLVTVLPSPQGSPSLASLAELSDGDKESAGLGTAIRSGHLSTDSLFTPGFAAGAHPRWTDLDALVVDGVAQEFLKERRPS